MQKTKETGDHMQLNSDGVWGDCVSVCVHVPKHTEHSSLSLVGQYLGMELHGGKIAFMLPTQP